MTIKELLRSIYSSWHGCALKKSERGLPKGTLCDVCEETIKEHLKELKPPAEKCVWKIIGTNLRVTDFHTKCGQFHIHQGQRAEDYKFCPYCGREIQERE